MDYLLDRPELAATVALAAGLAWVVSAFTRMMRDVSGDDVGARLDALAPRYEFVDMRPEAQPAVVPEPRDYSGDRGAAPDFPLADQAGWVPIWRDFYAETARRLGINPLGTS